MGHMWTYRCFAHSRPMPELAPVMIMVLPEKSAPLGMCVDPNACPTMNCWISLKVAILWNAPYILDCLLLKMPLLVDLVYQM